MSDDIEVESHEVWLAEQEWRDRVSTAEAERDAAYDKGYAAGNNDRDALLIECAGWRTRATQAEARVKELEAAIQLSLDSLFYDTNDKILRAALQPTNEEVK